MATCFASLQPVWNQHYLIDVAAEELDFAESYQQDLAHTKASSELSDPAVGAEKLKVDQKTGNKPYYHMTWY